MKQTLSQTFRAHTYKLSDSFEDLKGKTIVETFNYDMCTMNVNLIVTNATMLVVIDKPLSAKYVYNNIEIMSEIEKLTGVTKDQFINPYANTEVKFNYDNLKEFVESDTLSPEWLEKAKAWHTTPREVPDWYKKLGPDPKMTMKW